MLDVHASASLTEVQVIRDDSLSYSDVQAQSTNRALNYRPSNLNGGRRPRVGSWSVAASDIGIGGDGGWDWQQSPGRRNVPGLQSEGELTG
jgi:hypothetical protein